jgi:PAS domain S-box-containing protein
LGQWKAAEVTRHSPFDKSKHKGRAGTPAAFHPNGHPYAIFRICLLAQLAAKTSHNRGSQLKLFGIELESPRRKRGQQSSQDRENYLSFILDRVPAGIMQTGVDGRYVYVNSYFCELVGRLREELVGLHFEQITHPDDVVENARLFAQAVATGAPYTFRKRYVRPDGTAVWTEVNVTALSERHEGLLSVVVDLTSRMRAEAQKNLLIEELNHRVKNTLSAVQSLAAMTIKHSLSPKMFYDTFLARLMALSATHNLLTRRSWEEAPLHDLIAIELEPYVGREPARLSLIGPTMELSPRQTISLGMVFHELATNAAKYGALSASAGRISISWSFEDNQGKTSLRINWRERGGPPVKTPLQRGFGSRLIEQSVTHELGGSFRPRYSREGFQCTVIVPIMKSGAASTGSRTSHSALEKSSPPALEEQKSRSALREKADQDFASANDG